MQFLYNFKLLFISVLMVLIGVLLGVAFLTLMERKLLSYMQNRKGPNKVGMMGIFQPFSDAVKLFMKENFYLFKFNFMIYYLSPMFLMMLMLFLWITVPMDENILMMDLGMLFMFSILSMSVYGLMFSGWCSNSMYSLLGSLRSIAQTIFYEVSMIILMLNMVLMIVSYNFIELVKFQKFMSFFYLFNFLLMMFFFIFLAELNRTPFDLAEGESELVSGFNVEYMSGLFALIFLAEYGNIMFMMMLFLMFFFGSMFFNYFYMLIYIFMLIMVIWVRATFPRLRYDKLMILAWKVLLPNSLNLFIYYCGLKIFLEEFLI
uniref:NADH-ubiquinone oxidoreductase chain 1 n=1 Tax=Foenatopus ruficollis TaxID=1738635 RepID=A0A342I4F1_9HYME|nr:NADH dehydrogenase subunit 1 [Foenatopus ruficollis]